MKKVTTALLIVLTSCVVVALPPGKSGKMDVKQLVAQLKNVTRVRIPRGSPTPHPLASKAVLGESSVRQAMKVPAAKAQEIVQIAQRATGQQMFIIGEEQLANLALQDNGKFLTPVPSNKKETKRFQVLQPFSVVYPQTGEFQVLRTDDEIEISSREISFQTKILKMRDSYGTDINKELRAAALSEGVEERPAIFDWELPALLVNDTQHEFFGVPFSLREKTYLPVLRDIDIIQREYFVPVKKGFLLTEMSSYPATPQASQSSKKLLGIIDLRPRVFKMWYEDIGPLLQADVWNGLFFSEPFYVKFKQDPQDVRRLVVVLRPMEILTKGQENYYIEKNAPHIFFKEGDVMDITKVDLSMDFTAMRPEEIPPFQVELFRTNWFDLYEVERTPESLED